MEIIQQIAGELIKCTFKKCNTAALCKNRNIVSVLLNALLITWYIKRSGCTDVKIGSPSAWLQFASLRVRNHYHLQTQFLNKICSVIHFGQRQCSQRSFITWKRNIIMTAISPNVRAEFITEKKLRHNCLPRFYASSQRVWGRRWSVSGEQDWMEEHQSNCRLQNATSPTESIHSFIHFEVLFRRMCQILQVF